MVLRERTEKNIKIAKHKIVSLLSFALKILQTLLPFKFNQCPYRMLVPPSFFRICLTSLFFMSSLRIIRARLENRLVGVLVIRWRLERIEVKQLRCLLCRITHCGACENASEII